MSSFSDPMPLIPTLEVLRDLRRDEIVVTTMGSAREWPKLSTHPFDLHYIPAAMGHAPLLALGLALAQPQRKVWCFNGDGSLLMNLGCLVTIAAQRPRNFGMLLLDNGSYEVTGGQATPAARSDFVRLSQAAGFRRAAGFERLADWQRHAPELLAEPGPWLLQLRVGPASGPTVVPVPGPFPARLAALQKSLAESMEKTPGERVITP